MRSGAEQVRQNVSAAFVSNRHTADTRRGLRCRHFHSGYKCTAGVRDITVDLAYSLGERGRAFVKERFSVEKMIQDLEALYWHLARQRGIIPRDEGSAKGRKEQE